MKFSFIGQVAEEQRQLPPGVRFPVVFMCRMLEVTRQGYYEWKKRPVSAHDQKDAELAARIRYLHQERHENRAGIERILWDLQEEGYVTSERRVRRLARAAGLQCVHPGPSARTTVQDSRAIGGLVDLVDRQFTAPEPDQLWVGDITYIWTYSGFAYLATLIDMCSNKVVGCVHSRGAGNWCQLTAGSGGSQGFPAMASRMASSAVMPWAAAVSM